MPFIVPEEESSVKSRPAWSTYRVPGQPELYNENLSQKQNTHTTKPKTFHSHRLENINWHRTRKPALPLCLLLFLKEPSSQRLENAKQPKGIIMINVTDGELQSLQKTHEDCHQNIGVARPLWGQDLYNLRYWNNGRCFCGQGVVSASGPVLHSVIPEVTLKSWPLKKKKTNFL